MRRLSPRAPNEGSAMLAVVDTNLWVSAFLTPRGSPGRLRAAFRSGKLLPAYSSAIEAEYRDVPMRP
jgi:predicted nucleic acid-binding protein